MSFRVNNSRNIQAIRLLFVSKCFKFYVGFKDAKTISQKVFHFLDNCVRIGSQKLSVLWLEYLLSVINGSTNSLKISDQTKTDVFQLSLPQNEEKIKEKCCRADFDSVTDPLTHCLAKGLLKQDLLDI